MRGNLIFCQLRVLHAVPGHAAQCILASFAMSQSHCLVLLVRVCSCCSVTLHL